MYLFNPDHDLALANFMSNFTSPASARKLKSDLAILPIWYASDNAVVIAEGKLNHCFLENLKGKLPIHNTLVSFSQLEYYPHEKVNPWGWNPAVRRQLLESGIDEQVLPTLAQLDTIQFYSGRQNAVKLLSELKQLNDNYCGESYFFTNIDELLSYVYASQSDQVLKMPLSGSGKGIVWIKGEITDKQIDWCKRVIYKQGGVVIEPVLNRVQDFAMEFEMTDSGIQFTGYSLFQSATSGAYIGNILMSDVDIEKKLSGFIGAALLNELKSKLEIKLSTYFPKYRGYLGVDMMICKSADTTFQLQPCVEINMRMNMGIVAHRLYERFVHPNSSGIYSINYFKKEGEAKSYEQKMRADYPLIIENGKIKNGYFALTAVDEKTSYAAYVSIKQNHEDDI
jgi:hypothetical protein